MPNSTDGPTDEIKARLSWWVSAAFLVLIAIGAVWLWQWQIKAEWRAIERMPAWERERLYRSAFDEFQRLCQAPRPEFRARCERQATFLLEFPECGPDCQAATDSVLRPPAQPR